jgi:hypothetical protein
VDRELPDKHGVLSAMYDERAFSRDVIRELPELASELSSEEDLLHVQVGVLGRVTREEIERNNLQLASRIFVFLEKALAHPRAISEIANAIAISFVELEELQRTDAGRRALEMMPPRLKECVTQEPPHREEL